MAEDLARTDASSRAAHQVEQVTDSPSGRFVLARRFYHALDGRAAGYGRAELSFLRWEIKRGVLNPLTANRPGSAWWRAVNDRLLRDKIEASLLHGASAVSAVSARSVALWSDFLGDPSPAAWFRAHNASILGAYLEHHDLALCELLEERFMMNVALLRVIFAHALIAAPRLALGPLAPLGGRIGDPRTVFIGLFLDLRRVFPQHYPLTGLSLPQIIAAERPLARWLDYGVIGSRPSHLYEFAAGVLGLSDITMLIRGDEPCYAGPFSPAAGWANNALHLRLIARATRPRHS
ncbi:MAG TPA: hypothetical protein VG317_08930 [Pseudonocardiaceae bacterium]|jgi:hypothetical protein|nr:hypothetical protein [Pseudonocardiaceae bacterium]